ncbi:TPM domain-containing protein [Morganella morganii]|uniref:TPM domain-containing protein n=1 Tax=Morganella morganii TaxID=582 RepID=UPI00046A1D83|nr:TPM domain-containing protein [Morganella morganii]
MRNEINRCSRWLQGIFSLFLLLFAVTAFAQTETFPRMQGAVTDTAGLLTDAERSSIEQKLNTLRARTGAQIAVLTVKTTGTRDIESYAEKVFNKWRLGRISIDDGILLLVAVDDRAMRIEVGYGLEGAVSDVTAKRILNDYFIPHFQIRDYAGGIDDTVDALIAAVRNEPLPPVNMPAFFIIKQAEPVGWIDILLGAVLAMSAWMWAAFLYSMVKRFKLKAAIPVAIIIYLIWYADSFNNPDGNGFRFGEHFLYEELPRWSQFLFLQILPSWMVIILIFTMFFAFFFLFLLCLGGLYWILTKIVRPQKVRVSICVGFLFGGFAFIFGLLVSGGSPAFGVLTGAGFGLFIGIGHYLGFVTVGSGGGGSGKGGKGGRGGRGGRGGGGYSGGSRSSSRSSSGGGGRSGGGGASGRW